MAVFHSTHPFMMRKKFLLTSSASNNILQTKTQHVFCLMGYFWGLMVLLVLGCLLVLVGPGGAKLWGGQVVGPCLPCSPDQLAGDHKVHGRGKYLR